MDATTCQFCPKDERVPATRTHTDPEGYVYRLCQRHYAPIGQWLKQRRTAKEAAA